MGVGANLRRLREHERGWTQAKLAEDAGVQQSDISKWERGRATPDVASLLKLAAALECPLDALIAGQNPRYDLIRHQRDVSSTEQSEPADSGAETVQSTYAMGRKSDTVATHTTPLGGETHGGHDPPVPDALSTILAKLDTLGPLETVTERLANAALHLEAVDAAIRGRLARFVTAPPAVQTATARAMAERSDRDRGVRGRAAPSQKRGGSR